jgi:hypothetical protein
MEFIICSVDLNMATISGKTHIKTIFSFSQGTGKNFICNALCSSEDSFTQLIHILHFFHIEQYLLQQPPRRNNSEESKPENEGAKEWVLSSFHPTIRTFPVQKDTKTTEEAKRCTIWLENCPHRDMTQSRVVTRHFRLLSYLTWVSKSALLDSGTLDRTCVQHWWRISALPATEGNLASRKPHLQTKQNGTELS